MARWHLLSIQKALDLLSSSERITKEDIYLNTSVSLLEFAPQSSKRDVSKCSSVRHSRGTDFKPHLVRFE